MDFRRLLLAILSATALAGPACAVPLGPPNLPQATTANNPDLLLIWPCPVSCPTGGPLENIPWSTVKAQMQAALGSAYLQGANNLSDLTNITTARSNLGLGSAATASTGVSGAQLCLLSSSCTWSSFQLFNGAIGLPAATTVAASENTAPGVAPTSPNNGDSWLTSAGVYWRVNGATIALTGTPLVAASNLSDVASAVTARTNILPSQTGANGKALESNGTDVAFQAVQPPITYAEFQEQQTSGTASACAFSSGAWHVRTLNTTIWNTISGVSLASNQITFTVNGAYRILVVGGSNTAVSPGLYRTRIRDVTDSITLGSGAAVTIQAGQNQPTSAQVLSVFSGTKTFELDSWVSAGTGTCGTPMSTGDPEIYTDVIIEKIG